MATLPDHPTLTLGEQLVTTIGANWGPSSPDAVSDEFDVPITPKTIAAVQGRKVFVLPVGCKDSPASKVKNKWVHRFLILAIEKYPEDQSGLPTKAWVKERVKFVLALKGWIDFPKDGATLKFGTPQRSVWTENFEEIEIYDPDMLSGHSLFWSTIEVFYGEVL
jgi:hypothetical protein